MIVENFPNGFPRLSCFLDSDDAFMVYRRFGTVFSRLLLSKQDELSRMEMELNGMDKNDEANGDENYLMSNTLDVDRPSIPTTWPQSRPELLAKMEKTALEYGKSMTTLTPAFKSMKLILPLKADLLLKAQQLKALEQPSRRDYKSVLHFMENDGGPLFEEEAGFIYEKEDLVTLRPGREHAWLDNVLEQILQKCRCGLLLVRMGQSPKFSHADLCQSFCSAQKYVSRNPRLYFPHSIQETKEKTDDADIHYYDRGRIRTCTTLTITIMVLSLLVIPIWLLYRFSVAGTIATSPDTIGVLLVFTFIFSAALSAFTKAKRHEIVAASAG